MWSFFFGWQHNFFKAQVSSSIYDLIHKKDNLKTNNLNHWKTNFIWQHKRFAIKHVLLINHSTKKKINWSVKSLENIFLEAIMMIIIWTEQNDILKRTHYIYFFSWSKLKLYSKLWSSRMRQQLYQSEMENQSS